MDSFCTIIGYWRKYDTRNGRQEEAERGRRTGYGFKELFMLAICATSIDALAVGVTFGTMGSKLETSIWASVILIGITTFAISLGGVFIGNAFGVKYKSKAEVVGGIILKYNWIKSGN